MGQAPGRGTEGRPAFDGPAGERLARVLGVGLGELLGRVDAVNLLPEWPGSAAKGDAFPLDEAREAAERLVYELAGRRVLLAGRGVAAAFGVSEPYFRWVGHRTLLACVVPHPSGVSHWWNEPANVRRARAFLRAEWWPHTAGRKR